MIKTEEQQFKDMLKELRQQHKSTQYELVLRNENRLLDMELQQLKNDNNLLHAENITKIKELVDMKFHIETFMRKEAISFMRLFKESCQDKEVTEEMQIYINNFIYKLTHCLFLSKRKYGAIDEKESNKL